MTLQEIHSKLSVSCFVTNIFTPGQYYLEHIDDEDKKDGVFAGKFDSEREAFEDEANKVFFKAMVGTQIKINPFQHSHNYW